MARRLRPHGGLGLRGRLIAYVDPVRAVWGIEGTASSVCDEVVDLVAYRSTVPGIFMRHILEHNRMWDRILDNALASFTERMALILFTPEKASTEEIAWAPELGVPDIAFRLADITDRFPEDVTYTGNESTRRRSTVARRSSFERIRRDDRTDP
jgi:hypothetical protein